MSSELAKVNDWLYLILSDAPELPVWPDLMFNGMSKLFLSRNAFPVFDELTSPDVPNLCFGNSPAFSRVSFQRELL